MLAENLIDWKNDFEEKAIEKGREEGHEEGVLAGEALILTRQLKLKFGTIDATILQRVSEADSKTLLRWGDRVLTAEALDDIFEDRGDSTTSG